MKLKKGSIALLTLAGMFYMSVQKADACTRAVYIGPDNMVITGRTMAVSYTHLQQFLLIFLTHAFSSIFYTDYDFITLYSCINQNFGIIIAELDRIAEKITQDSLHHIHIGMYLNLSVHREVHLYILHTGYQIENFDNRSNIPHNIKAVSYTHLDVYKRQVRRMFSLCWIIY